MLNTDVGRSTSRFGARKVAIFQVLFTIVLFVLRVHYISFQRDCFLGYLYTQLSGITFVQHWTLTLTASFHLQLKRTEWQIKPEEKSKVV